MATGVKLEELSKLPKHEMQCVDCHNRPAHTFELPGTCIELRAIAANDIPATLPFIKKS